MPQPFEKQIASLMPQWDITKSGEYWQAVIKSQPGSSNVHVNAPLGSEDDKVKKDFVPVDENPPLNNQVAKGRRVATVAVAHGDHILMGKRRDNGKWTVPGGHVDEGEDMRTGALRELLEETGIGDAEHIEDVGKEEEVSPGLRVQPFRVKFADRPSTSMLKDPDGEIKRWQWVNVKDGIPKHIANNMHVPLERNILMSAIGLAPKIKKELMDTDSLQGFVDMQDLIEGIDYEMAEGVTDPNAARELAMSCLQDDPEYYKRLIGDEEESGGLKLDLGSGNFRQSGYLGVDTFPHDHGTVVHDLSMGVPFPDASASHVRATNSFHEIAKDAGPMLDEVQRVLRPGGQFVYEGPTELTQFPPGLVQTDFTSNEEAIEKGDTTPTYRQTFTRVEPDPATSDDAEPRVVVNGNDSLWYQEMPIIKSIVSFFDRIFYKDGEDIDLAIAAFEAVEKSGSQIEPIKDLKVVPIFKADVDKQLVYGVILAPDEVDAQEDWMTAEDIEKAAHYYLRNSRVVGSGHSKTIGAEVVESYIAPQDFETNDGQYGPQKIKKGSWVLGVRINDKKEWWKVKEGEYTGFSVGGFGLRDHSTSANV